MYGMLPVHILYIIDMTDTIEMKLFFPGESLHDTGLPRVQHVLPAVYRELYSIYLVSCGIEW